MLPGSLNLSFGPWNIGACSVRDVPWTLPLGKSGRRYDRSIFRYGFDSRLNRTVQSVDFKSQLCLECIGLFQISILWSSGRPVTFRFLSTDFLSHKLVNEHCSTSSTLFLSLYSLWTAGNSLLGLGFTAITTAAKKLAFLVILLNDTHTQGTVKRGGLEKC
jgi:hypothetical protein